jgi:hypothetical protein
MKALTCRASEAKIAQYLEPWTDPRVTRSWLALAGAADNRDTLELLPKLRQSKTPKLLVWGEDDGLQTVDYAERATAGSRKRATPVKGHESYMTEFTSVRRRTSTAPLIRRCCATPPPISCPATIIGPRLPIASRKRTSHVAYLGIAAPPP